MDHTPVTCKQAQAQRVHVNEEREKTLRFLRMPDRLSAEAKNHPEKLIRVEEL